MSVPAPNPGSGARHRSRPGHLTVGDGQTVPVSVAEDDDGIVLLVMLADPGPALDERPSGLVLEAITQRGLVRMRGTARRETPGLVRFEVDGDPEVVQRRQFVRVIAPQRVILDDACGTVAETHSLNISGGGMLVIGPDDLEIGTEVLFSIFLSEKEPPVKGLGRVVRAADDKQRAIVFQDISRVDRDRLIHFIFDRQRAALAVTRGDTI